MKVNYDLLESKAKEIRKSIIKMLNESGSGHPGGSLSSVEIMTTLYFHEMNIDPKNPKLENRDRFILSKGHAAPVLYATLAEKEFIEKEELLNLRKINSILQGHPEMKGTPGVEMSTGSLGQGFSVAVGMAKGLKIKKLDSKVFTILGDGELQEGIIWEAAMAASHYNLDNIIAFIDNNGLQIDGKNIDVMNVDSIEDKFRAFGWNVLSSDGHNFTDLINNIEQAKKVQGSPSVIVCKTVKGKGVSFMENNAGWHGKAPNDEETKKALTEIGGVSHE